MTDMRRLIEDPATPEGAREGLQEAAETAEPYDVDAGLRRLQAVLAAGGAAAASGTAAAATAGSTGLGKIGLAVALACALAGSGAIAYQAWGSSPDSLPSGPVESPAPAQAADRPDTTEPANVDEAPSSAPVPARTDGDEAPGAAAAEAPSRGHEVPSTVAEAGRASPPSARTAAPVRPEPAAAVGEVNGSVNDLREETLHLARVRSALERSPAEVLRLAREGQQRFPQGVFEEERRALIVLALDRGGQHDRARRAAEVFIERYPNGPLTGRVREIFEER